MKLFFLVSARDEKGINRKIDELQILTAPYLIVSGARLNLPNVEYRQPKGKYDAINFGARLVPDDFDVVALNDVDTKIHNLQAAVRHVENKEADLVFVKVLVKEGPQKLFYKILDFIRRRVPITASGELMLIRHEVLNQILPIPPCKAEDSYILFKALELKHKAAFCEECYVRTERTKKIEKEEDYKRINVTGIYQALRYTHPSISIRLFYSLLPFVTPLLLILGKRGYYWMRGILLGFLDYSRGDQSGFWKPVYMD